MCLLICLRNPDGSLLLAANRDERYDRPSAPPFVWPGEPRILAGRDDLAGGTWLAVNEHGVVAAVTNRAIEGGEDPHRRTRGGLPLIACRQKTAKAAAMKLQEHLQSVRYNGFNLLIADRFDAYIVQNAHSPVLDSVPPGLHVVANRGWDDMADERVALALDLLKEARLQAQPPGDYRPAMQILQAVCRYHGQGFPNAILRVGGSLPGQPSLCIHSTLGGTVSSTVLALSPDGRLQSYQFCPAAPCSGAYQSRLEGLV
jgi:uncharacterized protein with NRDE domain